MVGVDASALARAVRELHRPALVGQGRRQGEVCVECTSGGDPYTAVSTEWPCPTEAAIRKAGH